MSTKTLPKKPAPIDALMVTQIVVSDVDAEELAECCGMNDDAEAVAEYAGKLASLRHEVNRVLTWHTRKLKMVSHIPQPAHIKAHLELIQHHADALAGLLHPENIAKEILGELPCQKQLRHGLNMLGRDAYVWLKSLEGLQSQGTHNAIRSERLKVADEEFKAVFENQTVRNYSGDATGQLADCAEFVKVCKRYLPG